MGEPWGLDSPEVAMLEVQLEDFAGSVVGRFLHYFDGVDLGCYCSDRRYCFLLLRLAFSHSVPLLHHSHQHFLFPGEPGISTNG